MSGANECRVGVAHDSAQTDNLLKQPPPVSLIASRSASHPPHASRGRDKKEQRPRSSRECGGVGRLSDVVIARSERDAAIHPGLAKKAGLLRRCTPRNDGRDERWGRGVLLLPPPRSRESNSSTWPSDGRGTFQPQPGGGPSGGDPGDVEALGRARPDPGWEASHEGRLDAGRRGPRANRRAPARARPLVRRDQGGDEGGSACGRPAAGPVPAGGGDLHDRRCRRRDRARARTDRAHLAEHGLLPQ